MPILSKHLNFGEIIRIRYLRFVLNVAMLYDLFVGPIMLSLILTFKLKLLYITVGQLRENRIVYELHIYIRKELYIRVRVI